MVRKIHLPLLLLLCLVLGGVQSGCGGPDTEAREADGASSKGEGAGEEEDSSIPVEVVALRRGSIEAVLRFSTSLEA